MNDQVVVIGDALIDELRDDHGVREFFTHVRFHTHEKDGSVIVHLLVELYARSLEEATDVLERHGVDPAVPYAVFVGRITRQKGLAHLLRAAADLPGQLVLSTTSRRRPPASPP